MKKFFIITALVVTSTLSNYAQSAQKRKNVRPAHQGLSALKAKAEKGDAKAQLEYGKAIEGKSREEAAHWIQQAANQGLGEAWFWLGDSGLGKEKPIVYYEKAAERGHFEAFEFVFEKLLFRAGASADVAKAKKFADLARKLFPNQDGPISSKKIEIIDRCYEAGASVISTSDLPSAEEKKSFKESNTDCLYLKTGTPPNWNEYRKCLLSNDDVDVVKNNMAEIYANGWVKNDIAEIYANGWGVKRNAKLAIALVCHASSVPDELEGIVETLYSTKDQDRLQVEFKFCDHITSGMNGGICAARAEEIASKKRDAEVASLIPKLTGPEKASIHLLREIANEFFSERAGSELNTRGSARIEIAIEEEAKLKEELVKSLKSFEEGHLPKESDFARSDKDLNDIYSKIMKQEGDGFTKGAVETTQPKWFKYRDAWVKFAGLRYPSTSPEVWKTWLTKQRIEQLKVFVQTN
ncbi:MAG: hypothetical protein KBD76_15715 [Bacteriovorax sp.]|nr:hypothetical protein [Bacteriovorax sp.]